MRNSIIANADLFHLNINGKAFGTLSKILNFSKIYCPKKKSIISSQDIIKNRRIELPFNNNFFIMPKSNMEENSSIEKILLHGSFSTGDYCDFSDIDIIVIINDKKKYRLTTLKNDILFLKKLLFNCYIFDPLMHHGLMFFNSSFLENYDEIIFPIDAIKKSVILYGKNQFIEYRLKRKNPTTLEKDIKFTKNIFDNFIPRKLFLQNDYLLKEFVSSILLIPSIILAQNNIFVYKRESFSLIPNYLAQDELEIFKICTSIRNDWKRLSMPLFLKYLFMTMHPSIIPGFYSKFGPRYNVSQFKPYQHILIQNLSVLLKTITGKKWH